MSFRRVSRVLLELTVCLQSSIAHFWRKSRFIPCEIGLYDGILEFGKTHFSLERVPNMQRSRDRVTSGKSLGRCTSITFVKDINMF